MAQPNPTDPGLIARARDGDRSAQQELWRSHRRWVAAIVLAHRPRTIEVDDLMQDVAIRFISRLSTLRDPAAFRPWLRQIIINVCRGAARGVKPTLRLVTTERGHEPGEAVSAPLSRDGRADEEPARRDAAQLVLAQAMSLPPDYREPLLLRCVRGLTYQEIGSILGLPVTTIETRLARARRMLREEVGDAVLAGMGERDPS